MFYSQCGANLLTDQGSLMNQTVDVTVTTTTTNTNTNTNATSTVYYWLKIDRST